MFLNYSFQLTQSDGVTPNSGQAANITFRCSPYATPANLIGGLTTTEDGTTGIYKTTGFSTVQKTKVYLSGTLLGDIPENYSGDIVAYIAATCVLLTGNQTVAGNKTLSGILTSSGGLVVSNTALFTNQLLVSGGGSSCIVPDSTTTGHALNANTARTLFEPLSGTNLLKVDPDGVIDNVKTFANIADALGATGTRSSTTQFHIGLMPTKIGYHVWDAPTWYDWVNIFGAFGRILVKNQGTDVMFTRAGFTTKVSCKNICFDGFDSAATWNFKAMDVRNCAIHSNDDTNALNLALESSQFVDCDFSPETANGATFTSNDNNLFLRCTTSKDLTLQTNDKVFPGGLNVLDGVILANG